MMMIMTNFLFGIGQMYLISMFTNIFLTKKKSPAWRSILYFAGASLLLVTVNSMGSMFANTLAAVLLCFIMVCALFKSEIRLQYFTLGIASAIVMALCELLTFYITTSIFKLDTKMVLSNGISMVIYSFISILVFFATVWIFKNVIAFSTKKSYTVYSSANLGLILLPIVNIMIGYYILFESQYNQNVSNSVFGLILFILLVFVLILLLVGSENEHKQYLMKAQLNLMQYQEDLTTKIINNQEQHLEALRRKTHDYKNHLLSIQRTLSEAVESGDFSVVNQYIIEMLTDTKEFAEYSGISNKVLRVILVSTHQNCIQFGIDFDPHIEYSDFEGFQLSDLSAIFSNALDNALEACKQNSSKDIRPYIKVSIRQDFQSIFIHIKNSVSHKIFEEQGNLLTTKADNNIHGYGIKNIKSIVDNYNGTVYTEYTDQVFDLYISFPEQ